MKLLLNIGSGSLVGRNFELSAGYLTIGRGETCHVRFDPVNERIASKQHAYIEAKPDGFYLTDHQSSNGTYLNGTRIETAKLTHGDTIQFGRSGVQATIDIIAPLPVTAPTILHNAVAPQSKVSTVPMSQDFQNHPAEWRKSFSNLGLGNVAAAPPRESTTGRRIGIGAAIFVGVFLSLIVMLLMFASVGIGAAIIASFVAFTPAVIYLLPLIWLDRYDPEPFWLLAVAFAWGALVAVFVSFIVNTIIGIVVALKISPAAGEIVGALISAPIFEEGSKGLGVVLLLIFFRRYFDDILDGIIFAGVIALGFATVENVLYYGGSLEGGSQALLALFILRGIMSPFAHVTFTSMTGIGCGISRESHKTWVRVLFPALGYVCAMLLHALWNGLAVIGGLEGFIVGYFFLEVPFFLIFVGFAFYTMYRQNKILKEMLAIDVARGLISQENLDTVTSAFRSSVWILGSLTNGKFKARTNFLRSVGKLGLSYWHIQRATAAQGQTGSFQQNPILRAEVEKWRGQI